MEGPISSRGIRRRLEKRGKLDPKPKRKKSEHFSFTKGYGWCSQRGKRSNS